MERRISRGEQVSPDAQIGLSVALLEHHAGELFRATLGNQVLSSILVLRAARGAYYHSAGTSREGMAIGASHLLIRTVVEILRDEGIQRFNLGGADANNPGLERFKTGFGGQAVSLEAAQFYLGNRLQKGLAAMVALLRRFAQPRAPVKAKSAASTQNQAQQS
jgi:lipid II:glycine glycyltransferase (peptidoglycan interpeptide bridge formation enzyme)